MNILTVTVKSRQDFFKNALSRAKSGLESGISQGEILNFENPAALFAHLSAKKWLLLNQLIGHKKDNPLSVREPARQVKRDVKRVHTETQDLVAFGLLSKTESGSLFCPYDKIHIDMTMGADESERNAA